MNAFLTLTGYRHHALTKLSGVPVLVFTFTALLLLSACGGGDNTVRSVKQVVRIRGSNTMSRLLARWAEEYMRIHPGVAMYTEGHGTETGIQALINGSADLATASRPLRAEEARAMLEKRRTLGFSILTSKDALSVYLHPDNPVRNLTLQQLRGLFSGRISSWSEIGGPPLPVQVIGRPPNSGTFFFFEEHVLQGESYASTTLTIPTTSALIKHIMSEPGAIGYGGLAFGADVIHASIDGIAPTAENVRNGSYPIARYLYLYAAEAPHGVVKDFIDWVLSDAGQRIVQEIGYIPLWEVDTKHGEGTTR
ncbi:MAG: phosphate ABC transporter substrate-binding protein [Bacteroidetes bacterium]|nr:phosphate ABC transporter substrate-binding protein [Bacteroidota bacterium]